MKVFLLLLRQELREKRLFFLGAGVAAVLFLGVGVATSLFYSQLTDQAEKLAFFVVFGVILVMGGGWLTRGFGAGGRRGFELARPLRAWQLGAAKLAAILLMAGAGGLLASLPDLLLLLGLIPDETGMFGPIFAHGFPLERLQSWARLGWLAGLAVYTLVVLCGFVFIQTLALPVAVRKVRSLVTLGALVLFGTIWSWSYDRVGDYGAPGIAIAAMPLVLIAFSGVGLYAAARSFARVLPADAHRAYSRTLSAGLVVVAALLAAGSMAATRVDFGALLAYTEVAASPDGGYWLVAGPQDQPGFVKILVGDQPLSMRAWMKPVFLADPQRTWTTYLAEPRFGRRAAAVSAPVGGGDALLVEVLYQTLVITKLPEFREVGRLASPFPPLSWEAFQLLLFREGSRFDLVAVDPGRTPPHGWQVRHYRLDAAVPALAEAGSWSFPAGDRLAPNDGGFWAAALALLDAGVPPLQILQYQDLVPLAGGEGGYLALPANPADGGWRLLDSRGGAVRPFDLPLDAQPAGEIRPGLLLATQPAPPPSEEPWEAWSDCRQAAGDPFTTLVVETSSGRILRRLPGFAAKANCTGDGRVWLVGPRGEPYDLGSADAEPRRLLPWRPRDAEEDP